MGSEFSYEDLSSFEIEKFSYTFLRDEIALGKQAFVIEQTPTDPYSGYTRQVVWLDQKGYYPLKIEFYDRKNSLIKTLIFNDYQKHLNQYWRAHELAMTNHQTGNKTVLTIDAIEFRTSLKERDFSKNHLKSIR